MFRLPSKVKEKRKALLKPSEALFCEEGICVQFTNALNIAVSSEELHTVLHTSDMSAICVCVLASGTCFSLSQSYLVVALEDMT